MADKGVISISSRLLTDEIQILTGKLGFAGGLFSYQPADNTEGWYYKLTNVTTTSTDLIAGAILQKKDTGIAVGSGQATIATSDKVKFLWIHNTGTTDGSTISTDSVYLNFDDVTVTHNGKDVFEIPAKQTWFCRVPSTLVGEIHAIAGQANAAGTGSGNVQCIVCAVIDDL